MDQTIFHHDPSVTGGQGMSLRAERGNLAAFGDSFPAERGISLLAMTNSRTLRGYLLSICHKDNGILYSLQAPPACF